MNHLEYAEMQQSYLAMDGKKQKALVEELAVRYARTRTYTAEYAEVNDDGSVRIVWIDGLHQAPDLEFDTSFNRFFRSEESAWNAAAASLRRNMREQNADDLRKGITCHGFAVCAQKGITLHSFAARLRYVHTITDDDEKDGEMHHLLQCISIFGLAADVHLRELPDYLACKKEVAALIKQINRGCGIVKRPMEFHRRYWRF